MPSVTLPPTVSVFPFAKIALISGKVFPPGGLGTRFHDIENSIVTGFYHARVRVLAW